jgi:hypothetical protein
MVTSPLQGHGMQKDDVNCPPPSKATSEGVKELVLSVTIINPAAVC